MQQPMVPPPGAGRPDRVSSDNAPPALRAKTAWPAGAPPSASAVPNVTPPVSSRSSASNQPVISPPPGAPEGSSASAPALRLGGGWRRVRRVIGVVRMHRMKRGRVAVGRIEPGEPGHVGAGQFAANFEHRPVHDGAGIRRVTQAEHVAVLVQHHGLDVDVGAVGVP